MKFIKHFGILLLIIFSFLLVDQYFFTPQYIVKAPSPFFGKSFYNPYKGTSLSKVYPINLHGHSNAWGGITNGHGNKKTVEKIFDSLGYFISGLTNYHQLSKTSHQGIKFEMYEHGYNLQKSHQLIIGKDLVVEWRDFIFPQTFNQKQHILNLLAKDKNMLVAIAHPGIRNGYSLNDMKLLQNYHLLEGLRPRFNFLNYWDTALAYGHPITLIGSDDFHNISDINEIGNHLTILFSNPTDLKLFNSKLLHGQSAVASLNHLPYSSIAERRKKIARLQNMIDQIDFSRDTMFIYLNEKATISWKSNNGLVKQSYNKSKDFYVPKLIDRYVRLEVITTDGISIYFNPLYRTIDGNSIDRIELTKLYLKKNVENSLTAGVGNKILPLLFLILLIYMWIYSTAKSKVKYFGK